VLNKIALDRFGKWNGRGSALWYEVLAS
jgi:hypothetical protein